MTDEEVQTLRSQVMGIGANLSAVIERSKETERENRFLREEVIRLKEELISEQHTPQAGSSSSSTAAPQIQPSTSKAPPVKPVEAARIEQQTTAPGRKQQNEIPFSDEMGDTLSSTTPSPRRLDMGTQTGDSDGDVEMVSTGTTTPEQRATNITPPAIQSQQHDNSQTNVSNAYPSPASPSIVSHGAQFDQNTNPPLARSCSASEISLGIRRRSQYSIQPQRPIRHARLAISARNTANDPTNDLRLPPQPNTANGLPSQLDGRTLQFLSDNDIFPTLTQAARRGGGVQAKRPPLMRRAFRRFPTPPTDGGRGLGFFLGNNGASLTAFKF